MSTSIYRDYPYSWDIISFCANPTLIKLILLGFVSENCEWNGSQCRSWSACSCQGAGWSGSTLSAWVLLWPNIQGVYCMVSLSHHSDLDFGLFKRYKRLMCTITVLWCGLSYTYFLKVWTLIQFVIFCVYYKLRDRILGANWDLLNIGHIVLTV